MDLDKLITLMSERRSLWDLNDKNYHIRETHAKLWDEVAEEMNSDVENIKKKWRGLRDTFRKEVFKSKKRKSEEGGPSPKFQSTWPHFKSFQFLSDTIKSRKYHKTVSLSTEETSEAANDSEPDYEPVNENIFTCGIDSSPDDAIQLPSSASSNVRRPKREEYVRRKSTAKTYHNKPTKYAKDPFDEELLEADKARLKYFSNSVNEDSDLQFLNSLLPYLKSVPQNRKMIVRNKLQQVFIDEDELALSALHSHLNLTNGDS